MPKLPEYTEIFGIPFNITWIKEQTEVDKDSTRPTWGQLRYGDREIRIAKDLPQRDKLLTILEEITHGVLYSLEYDDLSNDHKFITPFVNGLFTALEKAGMLKGL